MGFHDKINVLIGRIRETRAQNLCVCVSCADTARWLSVSWEEAGLEPG